MNNLKNDKLYKSIGQITEYSRKVAAEIPEEDKYPLQYVLKSNGSEASVSVAEAIGSTDPRDAYWKYGLARRALFGLSDALKQAHKLEYTPIDPELMVQLEQAIAEIDKRLAKEKSGFKAYFNMLDADSYKGRVRA